LDIGQQCAHGHDTYGIQSLCFEWKKWHQKQWLGLLNLQQTAADLLVMMLWKPPSLN
jgi:hypothetical protein